MRTAISIRNLSFSYEDEAPVISNMNLDIHRGTVVAILGATVGMTHMADWGMTRLSSGERQLVNVARALTQNSDILLLDEPCSHLDLINSRRMLNVMETIVGKGKTIIFTTHDPNAASAVADQIILLKKGELVAKGDPEQTLTRELLTKTYGGAIEVINTVRGPIVLAI